MLQTHKHNRPEEETSDTPSIIPCHIASFFIIYAQIYSLHLKDTNIFAIYFFHYLYSVIWFNRPMFLLIIFLSMRCLIVYVCYILN